MADVEIVNAYRGGRWVELIKRPSSPRPPPRPCEPPVRVGRIKYNSSRKGKWERNNRSARRRRWIRHKERAKVLWAMSDGKWHTTRSVARITGLSYKRIRAAFDYDKRFEKHPTYLVNDRLSIWRVKPDEQY